MINIDHLSLRKVFTLPVLNTIFPTVSLLCFDRYHYPVYACNYENIKKKYKIKIPCNMMETIPEYEMINIF